MKSETDEVSEAVGDMDIDPSKDGQAEEVSNRLDLVEDHEVSFARVRITSRVFYNVKS